MFRHRIVIAWTVLGLLGCSAKTAELEANTRQAAAGASADARQPVVDKGRAFELKRPGKGWKSLARTDANHLSPGAVAGLMSPGGVIAVLHIEPAPKGGPKAQEALAVARLGLTGGAPATAHDASIGGRSGRRFDAAGESNGVVMRVSGGLAVHQGRLYRYVVWGPSGDKSVKQDFETAFKALTITDGKWAPEGSAAETADGAGVDWRVKGGAFESGAAALRIEPPKDWRLVVGDALEAQFPHADVALERDAPGVVIAFRGEPAASGASSADLERRLVAAHKLGERAGVHRATLAKAPLSLSRRADEAGAEMAIGGARVGDRFINVVMSYRADDWDAVKASLEGAFGAVKAIPTKDAAKLVDDLAEQGAGSDSIGKTFAARHGVFREFEQGIEWTRPSGAWRLRGGEEARRIHKKALLHLEERRLGLQGLVVSERTVLKGNEFHAAAVQQLVETARFAAEPTKTLTLEDDEARTSAGPATIDGTSVRYQLLSCVHGEVGTQLLLWGPPANMSSAKKEVEAALKGLRFPLALRRDERGAQSYKNHRFGFEVGVPTDWKQEERTPPPISKAGMFIRWSRAGRWMGVLAVHGVPSGDAAWFDALLEQMLRDRIGPIARGTPTPTGATLGGLAARQVTWTGPMQRIDAVIATSRGTSYALVTFDKDGTTIDTAAQAFKVLQ